MEHRNVKRQSSPHIYKIWEIIQPFIIYYFLYSIVFLTAIFLCRTVAERLGTEYLADLTEHAETVTGLVGGLSMLAAVVPLLPMLRRELIMHKDSVCGMGQRGDGDEVHGGYAGAKADRRMLAVLITIVLAMVSSVGLNILLSLTGLIQISASYQEVAQQQYGIVFGVGMILFGLISPLTEEVIFRGLIFNRLRRYCPPVAAMIVSGILFGAYHGNLVQGLYGSCMGILMAYLYERMHCFGIPCLFHATANLTVYTIARNTALYGFVFHVPGCAVLMIISAGCIWCVEKISD